MTHAAGAAGEVDGQVRLISAQRNPGPSLIAVSM
jgi:hypothetical protein